MLILTRKINQRIVIGKALVIVRVLEIKNGQVTLEIISDKLPVTAEEEWWEKEDEFV